MPRRGSIGAPVVAPRGGPACSQYQHACPLPCASCHAYLDLSLDTGSLQNAGPNSQGRSRIDSLTGILERKPSVCFPGGSAWQQQPFLAVPERWFREVPLGVVVSILVITIAVVSGGSALRILKIRMVARLLGGDATRGVVDEHHLEKIEANVVEVGAERLGFVANPLGERRLEVGV